jgi:hypothetical protein
MGMKAVAVVSVWSDLEEMRRRGKGRGEKGGREGKVPLSVRTSSTDTCRPASDIVTIALCTSA